MTSEERFNQKHLEEAEKNRRVKGIYQIRCKNGQRYIGQSIDIGKRWLQHIELLSKGFHHNKKLQQDWSHLGARKFKFEVVDIIDIEDLDAAEQQYIHYYNSYHNGYNATPDGQGKNQGLTNLNSKFEDNIYISQKLESLTKKYAHYLADLQLCNLIVTRCTELQKTKSIESWNNFINLSGSTCINLLSDIEDCIKEINYSNLFNVSDELYVSQEIERAVSKYKFERLTYLKKTYEL